MYHIVLFSLQLAILIGSVMNLVKSIGDHQRIFSASLIVALAKRAAEENLSEDAIKRVVRNWRADTYRV